MTHRVLARAYRPKRFSELVGQTHVVRALHHALAKQQLHQALLFTGTRGVGKTTLSRLVAKALNCETGVTPEPCGVCRVCTAVDEGRFVDLIEVDAASRTGVDDTRELLDNVQYRPSQGRTKVYLIDEVHMFSKSSFNALLKTLEEPPSHVQFLLATTDPQKVPPTVLSRCLQFHLRRVPEALIAGHLRKIADAEGIEAEEAALQLVAQAGDGSLRDALSLLDQARAYGGDCLRADEVTQLLGRVDQRRLLTLLTALAAKDGAALLAQVAELDQLAPDYQMLLGELAELLQQLAVAQLVPARAAEVDAHLLALRDRFSPEDVQLAYQIALTSRREITWALSPRSGFEMALLRMLHFCPLELSTPPPAVAAPASMPTTPPGGPRPSSSTPTVSPPRPTPKATAEPAKPLAVVPSPAVDPQMAELQAVLLNDPVVQELQNQLGAVLDLTSIKPSTASDAS